MEERADVIIVGAGPAGSTTAALLAGMGWDVLLLDRARFPRDKTCGDGLTPRAVAVLQRLGLLDELLAAGYQRIASARVIAPTGEVLQSDFAGNPFGLPEFGLVVPRFELDERVRGFAVRCGARFRADVNITQPIYDGGRVVGVAGRAGDAEYAARAGLTILATGAHIGLLRAFGVLQQMPPGVNAVRGYFSGIAGLGDSFDFYFEPQITPGYAWVFPVGDGRANIGVGYWGRRRGKNAPDLKRLLADFMARRPQLAAAQPAGPVKGFPLRTDFPLYPPAGPGYLLVGEALGLVHPATGEGIDLAMESAELAAAAADLAMGRHDTGAAGVRPYARRVRRAYGNLFHGLHVVQRMAMGPHAINVLVHQARRRPHLARLIAGINLGAVSPWLAFAPRTWWDILH